MFTHDATVSSCASRTPSGAPCSARSLPSILSPVAALHCPSGSEILPLHTPPLSSASTSPGPAYAHKLVAHPTGNAGAWLGPFAALPCADANAGAEHGRLSTAADTTCLTSACLVLWRRTVMVWQASVADLPRVPTLPCAASAWRGQRLGESPRRAHPVGSCAASASTGMMTPAGPARRVSEGGKQG